MKIKSRTMNENGPAKMKIARALAQINGKRKER